MSAAGNHKTAQDFFKYGKSMSLDNYAFYNNFLNEHDFYLHSDRTKSLNKREIFATIKANDNDICIRPMGWYLIDSSSKEAKQISAYGMGLFCGQKSKQKYESFVMNTIMIKTGQVQKALLELFAGRTPYQSELSKKKKNIADAAKKETNAEKKEQYEAQIGMMNTFETPAQWYKLNIQLLSAQYMSLPALMHNVIRTQIQDQFYTWVHALISQIKKTKPGQTIHGHWIPFWVGTIPDNSQGGHMIHTRNVFNGLNRTAVLANMTRMMSTRDDSDWNLLNYISTVSADQSDIWNKLTLAKISICMKENNDIIKYLKDNTVAANAMGWITEAVKPSSLPKNKQNDATSIASSRSNSSKSKSSKNSKSSSSTSSSGTKK